VCGFETGALLTEVGFTGNAPGVVGSVAIESSIVRSGSYSLKLTPASGAAGYWEADAVGLIRLYRFYCRVTALPATTRGLLSTKAATKASLQLTPTGAIELYDNTTLLGTSTATLSDTGTWYLIEVTANGSSVSLYIDGALEASGSSTSLFNGRFGATDGVAATYTAYIDDMALYPDGTAAGNPGKAVMLLPTSLSAANGWVEGDGAGTAGMAAAVATRPPPGVASASETAATNIESPTNSATDNCDMNMTTYTAAGIEALDTINAIQAVVRHGEDIATNTKAGAVTILSNPAQAGENTFNYGNDGGAHGAEVGLWRTTTGTIQTAAVTVGTAPVLRVGKRTSTTRVVCVDFMGIYVDYTPAAVARVPRSTPYPQLLAH
jgi:hypothetical protein